ncbi:hypothetical protein [Amycolatopsis methanolica]|uniref:Uncharacterized protein n=1 Tax=Amycolatopsis methanolica 239 TaxID=1068978 RepID=A0A076MYR4_AMYME|nr:hypothetical protein [Amycolatopsis methanolica]AIJ26344.1 hypothetical protein AMETH_6252 [Amycolatopsis methanolica 239]AIJ26403.1 hypothetical protein AMETH_6311 [Amycolatopsis methanolica 239]
MSAADDEPAELWARKPANRGEHSYFERHDGTIVLHDGTELPPEPPGGDRGTR